MQFTKSEIILITQLLIIGAILIIVFSIIEISDEIQQYIFILYILFESFCLSRFILNYDPRKDNDNNSDKTNLNN